MTRLAILAFVLLMTIPAAPRCRIETHRGVTWLVCPCRGVTYQCEDWWKVQRVRGRWVTVR